MRVQFSRRGDSIAQNNALKRTFFVSNCPQTFSFVVWMATGGGGGVLAAAVVICLDGFMRAEIYGKRASLNRSPNRRRSS
jgi:fructose-1,6-bisphosphatase/sedoheptulose 1,7-bisphosphatase-like protein